MNKTIILALFTILLYSPASSSEISCNLFLKTPLTKKELSWVKKSKQNVYELLKKKKLGLEKKDLMAHSMNKRNLQIKGIPDFVEEVPAKGIIWRHYVGPNMDIILKEKNLKSGILPYIQVDGLGRHSYDDLTGVFLTKPGVAPNKVGLADNQDYDYIDFILPPDSGVLKIEDDIFLVPGQKDYPQWLKNRLPKYHKGDGVFSDSEIKALEEIQNSPGPMRIPIKIIKYRHQGHTVEVDQLPF